MKLWTSFDGRIGRRDYWLGLVPLYILAVLGWVLIQADGTGTLYTGVALLGALTLSQLAISAKRWHDLDQSGWNVLWFAVPLVNSILVIYLGFAPAKYFAYIKYGLRRDGSGGPVVEPPREVDPWKVHCYHCGAIVGDDP